MACITNVTTPYKSSCQVFLNEGEYCMSDLECPFDMVCWTLTEADSGLSPKPRWCMWWAYYNDTFEFGWIS